MKDIPLLLADQLDHREDPSINLKRRWNDVHYELFIEKFLPILWKSESVQICLYSHIATIGGYRPV